MLTIRSSEKRTWIPIRDMSDVWLIPTSWRQFLEECASPEDVVTVHTVFSMHAIHVPVNFRVMPFSPQKSHYTSLLFTR